MPETTRRGRRKRRQTKDRVLQARIPEQLDEELRDRAEQLGLSVSTVVRNVLLHTFDLVEGVVTDSAQIARALQGHDAPSTTAPSATALAALPGPADPAAEPPVIGWQEAVLNQNGICEKCNAILPRGERAAIGVPTQARATLLCLDCLAALSAATSEPDLDPGEAKQPKKALKRSKKPAS